MVLMFSNKQITVIFWSKAVIFLVLVVLVVNAVACFVPSLNFHHRKKHSNFILLCVVNMPYSHFILNHHRMVTKYALHFQATARVHVFNVLYGECVCVCEREVFSHNPQIVNGKLFVSDVFHCVSTILIIVFVWVCGYLARCSANLQSN